MRYQNINIHQVDFLSVAASLGYQAKSKSKKQVTLLNSDKEIVVYLNENTKAHYFNQHDKSEKGDVISLVQNELSCSFVEAKEYIQNAPVNTPTFDIKETEKKDHSYFNYIYDRKEPANKSLYLSMNRCISLSTLREANHARHADKAALFFHTDNKNKFTGYEYRGQSMKGAGKYSRMSLFKVNYGNDKARVLIIVESAINALSMVDLLKAKDYQKSCLIVSTGGNPSQYQKDMIKELSLNFDCVVLAQDNDRNNKGCEQAEVIKNHINHKNSIRWKPDNIGQDWNDKLKGLRLTS